MYFMEQRPVANHRQNGANLFFLLCKPINQATGKHDCPRDFFEMLTHPHFFEAEPPLSFLKPESETKLGKIETSRDAAGFFTPPPEIIN